MTYYKIVVHIRNSRVSAKKEVPSSRRQGGNRENILFAKTILHSAKGDIHPEKSRDSKEIKREIEKMLFSWSARLVIVFQNNSFKINKLTELRLIHLGEFSQAHTVVTLKNNRIKISDNINP